MKRTTAKKATLTFSMDESQLSCVPILQPALPASEDTSVLSQVTQQGSDSSVASPSDLETQSMSVQSFSPIATSDLVSGNGGGESETSQQSDTNNFYLPNEADELIIRAPDSSEAVRQQEGFVDDKSDANSANVSLTYDPVRMHWFFKTEYEGKPVWTPFSKSDSDKLEYAFISQSALPISVEGGRFDVLIPQRFRKPAYWNLPSGEIRRASWFIRYTAADFYVPFDEQTAEVLENEYAEALRARSWPRRVEMTNGAVVFHNATTWLFFLHSSVPQSNQVSPTGTTDGAAEETSWMNEAPKLASLGLSKSTSVNTFQLSPSQQQLRIGHSSRVADVTAEVTSTNSELLFLQNERAGVLIRGSEQFEIDSGEVDRIAHLVFVVHGIGPVCDLRGRSVYQCVDALRTAAQRIAVTHFPHATQQLSQSVSAPNLSQYTPSFSTDTAEIVGRVEFLPVFWHSSLHSDVTDQQLAMLTLPTVPKLRDFTNRTLMDVLFYASPRFGAAIREAVAMEINRLYETFVQRNPGWNGHVSLAGHSLGSVILFDLLANQTPPYSGSETSNTSKGASSSLVNELLTADQTVRYPSLACDRLFCFFAIGSPLSLFLTARGVHELPSDFHLPTCRRFFSLFHPYDPVAYRIEPLFDVAYASLPPVTLPHHKGRKRLHLEFREGLARGSEVTQKVVSSLKSTFQSFFGKLPKRPDDGYNSSNATTPCGAPQSLTAQTDNTEQITKIVEATIACLADQPSQSANVFPSNRQTSTPVSTNTLEFPAALNGGRRVDYQLQESPWESMNEYLGCVAAHTCYWESLDTALCLLTELYAASGISPLPSQALASGFPSVNSQASLAQLSSWTALTYKPKATSGVAQAVSEVAPPPAPRPDPQPPALPPAGNRTLQTGFEILKNYMLKPRNISTTNGSNQLPQAKPANDSPAMRFSELRNSGKDQKKDVDTVIDFG